MKDNNISVVINTLNEEKNIVDAIESAKKIAKDIVVVDMMSEDHTKELAKRAGARVYDHKREGYVEPARNFAIDKAKNEWVFILDADERIPEKLAKLIRRIVIEDKFAYVTIPRKNIIFGKWMKNSRWWPDYNIRFFKKGHVHWGDEIHSVPLTTGEGTDIEPKEENAIIHYHYTSLSQFVLRLDRYTTVQANERQEKFNWRDVIKKPISEFLSRYFFGKGYQDGMHGLALAGLQAFSEFIVELKVWEKQKYKSKKMKLTSVVKEIRKSQKEINYWLADSLVERNGNLVEKIRRKVKI